MLDELLEIFERDKKSSNRRSGGLRGRLASVLDGERSDRRYDADHRFGERRSDDRRADDRDRHYDRDDDDRDDRYRTSNRKKKREFDFLDFGD